MDWVWTALAAALSVALAHHLGLIAKVAGTAGEIAKCSRCSVFWTVLAVLLIEGAHPVAAFVAAIVLSYLTDWLGLALFRAAQIYDRLWQRINRRQNGLKN